MEVAAVTVPCIGFTKFRFIFKIGSASEHMALCHNLRRMLADIEAMKFDKGYKEWPLEYGGEFSVSDREKS